MKTSAVASALLLALASTSAVAATVYSNDGTEMSIGGRVEFRGDFGERVDGTMNDASRTRLNFKGSSEIASGLTAFAFYENELTGDDGLAHRYMYAGLDTEFGAFSAGRQDMAAVMISDMSDITTFSGIQQNIDASSDKTESVFAYRADFDAVEVAVTYAAESKKDEDLFSIAGIYSAPFGLDIGLGYSSEDVADEFIAGLGYSFEGLYLGGTFATGDNADEDEYTTYELSAEYKLTSQLALQAMYGYKEVADEDDTDHFELGAIYRFNSNLRTYAAYEFVQDTDDRDRLRLGLRYDF
ncbi:porin [Vibrio astriarenae]